MGGFSVTRSTVAALGLAFFTGGCAHTWVAGPNAQGDFAQVRAQCSIMARHGGNGIAVAGSRAFVAGAVIGNAIGNALQASADFNDCMEASGFLIADGRPPVPPAYAPATPPSAPQAMPNPYSGSAGQPGPVASAPPAYAPAPLTPQAVAAVQAPPNCRNGVCLVPPNTPGGDPTYTWPN